MLDTHAAFIPYSTDLEDSFRTLRPKPNYEVIRTIAAIAPENAKFLAGDCEGVSEDENKRMRIVVATPNPAWMANHYLIPPIAQRSDMAQWPFLIAAAPIGEIPAEVSRAVKERDDVHWVDSAAMIPPRSIPLATLVGPRWRELPAHRFEFALHVIAPFANKPRDSRVVSIDKARRVMERFFRKAEKDVANLQTPYCWNFDLARTRLFRGDARLTRLFRDQVCHNSTEENRRYFVLLHNLDWIAERLDMELPEKLRDAFRKMRGLADDEHNNETLYSILCPSLWINTREDDVDVERKGHRVCFLDALTVMVLHGMDDVPEKMALALMKGKLRKSYETMQWASDVIADLISLAEGFEDEEPQVFRSNVWEDKAFGDAETLGSSENRSRRTMNRAVSSLIELSLTLDDPVVRKMDVRSNGLAVKFREPILMHGVYMVRFTEVLRRTSLDPVPLSLRGMRRANTAPIQGLLFKWEFLEDLVNTETQMLGNQIMVLDKDLKPQSSMHPNVHESMLCVGTDLTNKDMVLNNVIAQLEFPNMDSAYRQEVFSKGLNPDQFNERATSLIDNARNPAHAVDSLFASDEIMDFLENWEPEVSDTFLERVAAGQYMEWDEDDPD